jgi:serine/threonine-protein kinase
VRDDDKIPPALPPVDDELAIGDVVGDYRIERQIGKGANGSVYLGVHQLIRKRAAIKLLRADSEPVAVERFLAEARVVNEIGHPNIVDVFAFGQTFGDRAYLAMEYLQGETLRARLARGRLDVETACGIARPLVRALAAAHAQHVVHRDVKPDNVFLVGGDAPTVKLLDFGMAKLLRKEMMTQTASGAYVGTPLYGSPEQARGTSIDHRADIYSLAGVIFEMVTGRPPFDARSAFEVISMHLREPAPHASTFAPVPRELDELLVQMLAKDPALRPDLARVGEVLDGVIDPQLRPTTPFEAARESVASIAKTERRPPKQAAPAKLPVWLLLAALVLGASGAFVLIRELLR